MRMQIQKSCPFSINRDGPFCIVFLDSKSELDLVEHRTCVVTICVAALGKSNWHAPLHQAQDIHSQPVESLLDFAGKAGAHRKKLGVPAEHHFGVENGSKNVVAQSPISVSFVSRLAEFLAGPAGPLKIECVILKRRFVGNSQHGPILPSLTVADNSGGCSMHESHMEAPSFIF